MRRNEQVGRLSFPAGAGAALLALVLLAFGSLSSPPVSAQNFAPAVPSDVQATPGTPWIPGLSPITLTWSGPTAGDIRIWYQWRESPSGAWTAAFSQTATSPKSFTYNNFKPNTTYDFRIAACLGLGQPGAPGSMCSDWATVTATAQTSLPSAPLDLAATAGEQVPELSDQSKVRLTWSAPVQNGGKPITGYVVQWREDSGSWSDSNKATISPPPTPLRHDVSGLQANTKHVFRVQANNEDASGQWAEIPLVGRPSSPQNPGATASTSEVSVNVFWDFPSQTGGVGLTGYSLQWRPHATGNWSDNGPTGSKEVAALATAVDITGAEGLQLGTAYNFRISASNEHRRSFWTPADGSVAATTVSQLATISATTPETLKEGNLDGAELTVDLVGATFRTDLHHNQFSITPAVSGVTFSGVRFEDNDTATLILAYYYTDAAMTADTDIAVVVGAAAHSGSADVTTNAVSVGHFVSSLLTYEASSVEEGQDAIVTITITEPVPLAVEMKWFFTAITATANVDYLHTEPADNDLTISPGTTSATINLPTLEDTLDENDERFAVTLYLSNTPSVLSDKITLQSGGVEVTITDNDDPPVLSANSPSVNEGDSGTTNLPFTVTLTPASSKQVTVRYNTPDAPSTATAGDDYVSIPATPPSTLTFAPGETSKTVNVQINGDNVVEPDETVWLELSNPTNATFSGGSTDPLQWIGTITNDDTAPTTINLSLDPASVAEEGGGDQSITVTAAFPDGSDTLPTDTVVSVAVGAAGDSATEGTDYQNVTNVTVTIPAEQVSGTGTLLFTPIDDSDQEGEEQVSVSGTVTDFTINSATLTLTEDDIPPTTSTLALSRTSVAENGGRTTLTVTLGGRATIEETTVEVAAQSGVFTVDEASKVIAAGATSASFTLTAVPNDVDAADVSASVSVTMTGGELDKVLQPDPASLSFTITDDDPTPRATLSVVPNPVDELDGGATISVTASLDRPSGQATTLTVSAAPSTGSNPAETSDFNLSPGMVLTIAAGQTTSTGTVEIMANADADVEDERLTVSATAVNSHGVIAPADVVLRIRDDDVPGARVTAADPVTVNEGGTASYSVALNVQPSGDVTIRVTPGSGSGVTVNTDSAADGDQDTLTFTSTTWNTAQTVTVRGAEDDDAVNDRGGIRHAIVRASTASEYDNISIDSVNVAVTDNDAAGFTIDTDPDTPGVQSAPVAVLEGETAEYTVMLDAAPAVGSVRISVSSSDTGAARASRSSLTFSRSNWDDPQTVRVTGQQDADSSSETVTITHAVVVASSADEFDVLGAQTVTVNVDDDETINYDSDGDGLIEVHNLAQLHAIRWDLDGNGTPSSNAADYAAAFENPRDGAVCPSGTTCTGYELMTDLVYAESTGAGWEPIGSNSSRYNATFEGNGHSIANLYINRAQHDVGLFGALSSGREIRNVALLNVSITVSGSHNQYQRAAALVGRNVGTVRNSYVTGAIAGLSHVGAVIGRSEGAVSNIYAVGSVSGNGDDVAGLIGFMEGSASLRHSYAGETVANAASNREGLGIVGWIHSNGVTVEDSFFDTDVTTTDGGSQTQAGGAYRTTSSPTVTNVSGKTGAELKAPTAAAGIYAAWSATDWDFGSDVQFPALQADRDGDGTATWQEFGYQIREVPDLTGAVPSVDLASVALEWTAVTNAWASQRPRPSFSYVVYRDDARIAPAEGRTLTQASHTDRTVTAGSDHRYVVAVEVNGIELRRGAERAVNLSRDTDGDGLIEITTRQQLNAMRYDLNGDGTVEEAAHASAFRPLAPVGGSACPSGTTCTGYELMNDVALSGSWTPIGGNVSMDTENPYDLGPDDMFHATFEGNGHTISGLRISGSGRKFVGLFGIIGGIAVIRDVCLSGVNVRGQETVGALVGYVQPGSTVSGSCSSGTVAGNGIVGGLVGWNRGTVERSYAEATVTGFDSSDSGGPLWSTQLGGLVGANYGTLRNAYATGRVTGVSHVAGLAGSVWSSGMVRNSYATGAVSSSKNWPFVGGLVGWIYDGSVDDSYWNKETSGQDEGDSQISRGGRINADAGQSTAGLQGPIGSTGIYEGWDSATIWEFGTSGEYPCLLGLTPGCEAQTSMSRRSVPAVEVGAGVTISETALSIDEGESATYTVVLDARPIADVVVYPASQGVTLHPSSLTFSSENWQTPQTVTVTAPQDADTDDDVAAVSHSISAFTGSAYTGVNLGVVLVTITDDDEFQTSQAQQQPEEESTEQPASEPTTEAEPAALTDREVLEAFYESTGGASWTNKRNWLSDRPLGEWHGATTDGQGRVTHLSLRNNNLSGSLPAALGQLDALEVLSLDRNSLSGALPTELGNLSNLTRLAMNRNSLTGSIPSELGNLSSLSIIGLARNQLSGSLPNSLSDLSGLTKLSLHDNTGLSGSLPSSFTDIANLHRLAIANTGLCAPATQAFSDWLAALPDVPGRDDLAACGSQE